MFVLKNKFILLVFLLTGISIHAQQPINTGVWRGVLKLNDSTELPFNFEMKELENRYSMIISNQQEHISVTDISVVKDSVFISFPVFNSELRLQNKSNRLTGLWINRSRPSSSYALPFSASFNEEKRFLVPTKEHAMIKERWKVTFEPGKPGEYFSVGLFQTTNNITSGTFTTETGDYRYLEGFSDDKKFIVSCFDGAHAYLFYATRQNGELINGHFYSGKSGHETWKATPDDQFDLRDPYGLTFLKPGYSKIDFSFKNIKGETVSLQDAKFKNKVVVVQLMGTWCPNCMDETKFLSEFYTKYKGKGVEVVGLAFERTLDFNIAVNNLNRLKNRFQVNYELLITGKNGKDQASQALPMLNAIMAFPTTIYIDKKGTVRKIYTGFNGPATGEKYTGFVKETTAFIEQLLSE
ncbi:MAG TPA: TlpA disulfide reductase family protein [Bacteroidia bacterium]|jgi:thiol-disulfide isomerase/thioredoxin|nr:TlpA disulfide reductase family protein [Bacteroidia bacterium]